uniref:LEC14B n=1 Tax=Anthurium amnicola TaxID=1678845 RepID=A0A1D1ZAQ5_9ARAE
MEDVYDDFEEEDVWSVMRESSPRARRGREATSPAQARRLPAGARMIPRSAHADGNGGSGGGGGCRALQQSAPVNIPRWSSNMYRKKKKKNPSDSHGYMGGAGFGYGHEDPDAAGGFGADDDGDEEDGMVPPHEWIARRLARTQISSFSMCEGAGRTLKGRDLSKVRNAVLTRTGFLE